MSILSKQPARPLHKSFGRLVLLTPFQRLCCWLQCAKQAHLMSPSSPRQRLQTLLTARWLEMGQVSLMHHRQVQILLNTLRREKELVSVQLIELLVADLYDKEFRAE